MDGFQNQCHMELVRPHGSMGDLAVIATISVLHSYLHGRVISSCIYFTAFLVVLCDFLMQYFSFATCLTHTVNVKKEQEGNPHDDECSFHEPIFLVSKLTFTRRLRYIPPKLQRRTLVRSKWTW